MTNTRKKKAKSFVCGLCHGRGEVEEPRDMHRSGGIAPCPWCHGTGKAPQIPELIGRAILKAEAA